MLVLDKQTRRCYSIPKILRVVMNLSYDQQLLKGTVSIMVLRLLRENDRYGYEILRELEQRSENVFSLNEGALYPVLHKLETEGYVASYIEESGGRKRKYYHLTPGGAALYDKKHREWFSFSSAVNMVLGGENHAKVRI